MYYIISQILGGIAIIMVACSYFCKKKSNFLIFQIIADTCYALAYLCLNIYVAGVITLFSSLRCYIFFALDKKGVKYGKFTVPTFIILNCIITLLLWQGWDNILPLITSIVYTITYAVKSTQLIRYLSIPPSVALCIYNVCFTLYSSALLDLLEVVVLVVSIIYFTRKEKSKKINI